VLTLLNRTEGATLPEMLKITGWRGRTVCALVDRVSLGPPVLTGRVALLRT